ncbi:Hypothetical protein CINCED_3A005505 [Cinara cedri]|uniref:Uncharacterized protein n=1 Tax=Cinara cedri TaxID=506608 RepID=A0A5E4NHQ1_9HEMI|nr:Hypothetical protein CINCED_3A005505 [Cinara cedri]
MEQKTTYIEDENDGELTTNQMKKKAQEIAKRFEKYHGRYHTSSSRCNTPLPITSADSIESIHSNSIGETSEKILLFRQYLEKDRKLVENSKIDEQNYDKDVQTYGEKVNVQDEKEIHDADYYESVISVQFQEEALHSLKRQVVELNEKVENYRNALHEKDLVLQMKIEKIDSLNKTIIHNNNLHLENVEAIKKTNLKVIHEERSRCTQKINHVAEEIIELQNSLDYVQQMCDQLKKDNIELSKKNNDLRNREINLRIDVENLSICYENEKKLEKLLKHNHESSKEIVENMEKELLHLKLENESLVERIDFLENNSMDNQEKYLETQLNIKDNEIHQLNLKYENLNKQFELNHESSKQIIENMEKELLKFKQANESLVERIASLENCSIDNQEKDNLQINLNMKDVEIQRLNLEYENLNKQFEFNHESSKKIIENMENELLKFKQANESLVERIASLENCSIDNQEKDNLQINLNMKNAEIQRLNVEYNKLNKQFENQTLETQQTESRWIQLKNAYLNDKDRMSALEKVIDELKINNDDLNTTNLKFTNQIKSLKGKLTMLNTENSTHKERIAYLINVIELETKKYQEALKKASLEYEINKNELIQQHDNDKILLLSCSNKLEENTLKLNEVNNQLETVLKENNSYKYECLELNNCLSKNDAQIFELNNVISELHKQTFQMTGELDLLKKENITLSEKLNGSSFENEDHKLLSERFQKQNKLLKVKIKTLKESENNRLLLQQQVVSLTNDIQASNQKSEFLAETNKQITTVLQNSEMELQNCYQLLNTIETKLNLQNQNIYTLRCILINLATLFSFDDCIESDGNLLKMVDSICNTVPEDIELQICIKKLILGSIYIFEYIIKLNNLHKHSKVELIAPAKVEKLVVEVVDKVKLSTQNEYHNQNNELVNLTEYLEHDALKSNISSGILEMKEVSTDLNGPMVKNIKNENNELKQFLKNIKEKLGLINTDEMNDVQLQNSLSELEFIIQEIKNENLQLKNQYLELQKSVSIQALEQPNIQKIDKYSNLNTQNVFYQSIEHLEENVDEENPSLLSDNQLSNSNKSKSTVESVAMNGDSKVLLARYKNLKSRFKEVRVKTVELEKKVTSLTCDLECANSKYKQLNDQYADVNETHEADIVQCQSEIENLMSEKLEAYRKLETLKEKHEILQNDYDQLKSNLDDNMVSDTETKSPHINEQYMILKQQLNDTQHLIDTAYSRVLCEWPPIDANSDWVINQSRKLDEIVYAKIDSKSNSSNNYDKYFYGFDLSGPEANQLKSCLTVIHTLTMSIITGDRVIDNSTSDVIITLMSALKTYTELFIDIIFLKNISQSNLVDELFKLSKDLKLFDVEKTDKSNKSFSKEPSSSEESVKPLNIIEEKPLEKEDIFQFQQAIAERDQLIKFLSDKISKSEYLNTKRNIDDIRLVRDKLDKALTAVHERDVRCNELTLELTRLLEERDMLQLKLSNSIRQIQLLSDDKSNVSEEKYGSKNIDDKLEELHSLEYIRDAGLFTDQEQRHMSQMELHQSHQASSITPLGANSSDVTEKANTSQSWFKDVLW